MSDRTKPPTVRVGMILMYRNAPDPKFGFPVRYELHTVTSVRLTKKGARVGIVRFSHAAVISGSCFFPDGIVADPFVLFELGDGDLRTAWDVLSQRQSAVAASVAP